MSEMIATANAKSIEEIKSFLSKQKETYKIPYETHPADRLRQCVFAGMTNRQDFLPRDRTGNRRFIPIPVDAAQAEVHILDNEAESRAYIDQLWAEAMTIYNSGDYKLTFSPAMQEALQICQKDFMQEDTQAGMIYAFLEDYTGDRVCSKQLYAEALGNLNLPAEWENRAICEIMTAGIANGEIKGWTRTLFRVGTMVFDFISGKTCMGTQPRTSCLSDRLSQRRTAGKAAGKSENDPGRPSPHLYENRKEPGADREAAEANAGEMRMEQKVIYNGQILTLTRFWATGEPCLWITDPQQIERPKMEFVGGHPDEYCIFLKNLTETELAQITSLDGAPLDVKEELSDIE